MKRIEFLKRAGLGLAVLPIITACDQTDDVSSSNSTNSSTTGSTNGSSSSDCTITNSETAGPFPTKDPNSLKMVDIRSDRKGVALNVKITIKNKNTGCAVLKDALVDIWHCDADGSYSEYGGGGMQATNYTSVHFLRGRQSTDTNGLAGFTTIYPGWYGGRAPHIHVHIYDANGRSLLVTQIAFPKTICDNVYTNATTFYKKGLQDTTNERDNVFSDGVGLEMASVAGSINDGYTLTHTIVVNG